MNELKFPDDDINGGLPVFAAGSSVIKDGWLWKQGEETRRDEKRR
jgi:hypothetical protein